MKRILAGLVVAMSLLGALSFFNERSRAGVICALPFTLANATLADATQVMANFNALVSCFVGTAQSGANLDITSLGGLTTPITPTQGGSPVFYSQVTSTGSANAQIVGSVIPANFSLTQGYTVIFKAGFSNTGATQINVVGTGLTNVYRATVNVGIQPLVGGEIIAGQTVVASYDGTQLQLHSAPYLVGEIRDFAGGSVPLGWALADGTCASQVGQAAALFAAIGDYSGGVCGGGNFGRPDLRGRLTAGLDPPGIRINFAGSGCAGNVLGTGCGAQNQTLAAGQIPQMTVSTFSLSGQTATDHRAFSFSSAAAAAGTTTSCAPGAAACGGASFAGQVQASIASIDVSGAFISGQTVGAASPTAVVNLNPLLIVNKIIKY